MAFDMLAWRGCALQSRLGAAGLRRVQKRRALHATIVRRVPERTRTEVLLTAVIDGVAEHLDFGALEHAARTIDRGDPTCGTCPLAGGRPVGCWRTVRTPVEELVETALFTCFSQERRVEGSIVAALDADVVSRVGSQTPWHTERGPTGLACRDTPLSDGERDSAQLLAALAWRPMEHPALVQGLAGFWAAFASFVEEGVSERVDPGLAGQGGQRGARPPSPFAEWLALGALVRRAADHGAALR